MTKKTDDAAAEDPVADDFAAQMPSWMPDGISEEVEAQADVDAAPDEADGGLEAEPADDAPVLEAEGDDDGAEAGSVEAAAEPAEDSAPGDEVEQVADGVVTLPPKARLPQIEVIVDQLTAAIDAEDLVIDAREVEDITTPVVTAIISALNSRADRTPPAAVLAPTPAFVDAFSDLGLFQDLMKMEFRQ